MKTRLIGKSIAAAALAGGLLIAMAPISSAADVATLPSISPTTVDPHPSKVFDNKFLVPVGYVGNAAWHCVSGSSVADYSISGGPGVVLRNLTPEPKGVNYGTGFSSDVINLSNTATSWIEVKYTCIPSPIDVGTFFTVPGRTGTDPFGRKVITSMCPYFAPNLVSESWEETGGTFHANTPLIEKIFHDDPTAQNPEGVIFTFTNSNRIGVEMHATIQCIGD